MSTKRMCSSLARPHREVQRNRDLTYAFSSLLLSRSLTVALGFIDPRPPWEVAVVGSGWVAGLSTITCSFPNSRRRLLGHLVLEYPWSHPNNTGTQSFRCMLRPLSCSTLLRFSRVSRSSRPADSYNSDQCTLVSHSSQPSLNHAPASSCLTPCTVSPLVPSLHFPYP